MEDLVAIICRMAERIEKLELKVAMLEAKYEAEKANALPRGILPVDLRLKTQKRAELNNLVREGFIIVDGDHLVWKGGNVTLLAFVCGRLWAGDRLVKCKLTKGKDSFPAKRLENLFRVKNLKQSRNNIFIRMSESLTESEQEIYDIMKSNER